MFCRNWCLPYHIYFVMELVSLARSFDTNWHVIRIFYNQCENMNIVLYFVFWYMNIISLTRSFAPNWHGIRIFDNQCENGTFVSPSLLHNFPINGFL